MKWKRKLWYSKEEMKRLQEIHSKHDHILLMSGYARVLYSNLYVTLNCWIDALKCEDIYRIEHLSRLELAYQFTTRYGAELGRFEELFEYAEEQLRCESISDKIILILKRIKNRIIH